MDVRKETLTGMLRTTGSKRVSVIIQDKKDDTNLQKDIHETTEYLEAFRRNLLLNEKNEFHNQNLHISGLLNEEKVDIGDTKVDIENEKVDIQDRKVDIEDKVYFPKKAATSQ